MHDTRRQSAEPIGVSTVSHTTQTVKVEVLGDEPTPGTEPQSAKTIVPADNEKEVGLRLILDGRIAKGMVVIEESMVNGTVRMTYRNCLP